jgi:hypothetical protein
MKSRIKLTNLLNPIFKLENGSDGRKGYIGSNHIQLPTRQNELSSFEKTHAFCKTALEIHKTENWITEPVGTGDKVFEQESFNKLLFALGKDSSSAQSFKKGGALIEFDRFGLIERHEFDDNTIKFRLTPLGKKVGKIKDDTDSMNFYKKMIDVRQEWVRNRFNLKKDWKEYGELVFRHTAYHKTIFWFDLWLLAFCTGSSSYFDYNQINQMTIDIRKCLGITKSFDDYKMKEFYNFLMEEFHNSNDENILKTEKIDITNLISKYEIMADYLNLIGYYKKDNITSKLRITFIDNVLPPKTIRNNTTDKSIYFDDVIRNISTENHHIVPHALANNANGLNEYINHKLNKLSISERDHKQFPTQLDKNVYRQIEIKNGKICFINLLNKKDMIILKDTKHIDLKILKNKVIPYNKKLLKKIK